MSRTSSPITNQESRAFARRAFWVAVVLAALDATPWLDVTPAIILGFLGAVPTLFGLPQARNIVESFTGRPDASRSRAEDI